MYESIGRLPALIFGLALITAACAQPPPDEPDHPTDPATLEAILADIEAGWENADGTPFREHFLDVPGARYIETGGQNEGLSDLVENHVEPEGEALEGLELELTNTETHFEGPFAWAVTDVEVRATVRSSGEELHRRGYQTVLFRLVDGAWKVVHTHNSTRPVEG